MAKNIVKNNESTESSVWELSKNLCVKIWLLLRKRLFFVTNCVRLRLVNPLNPTVINVETS